MSLIPPLGPNRHVRRGVEWSCAISVTLDEGVEPDLRRDSVQPLDDELAPLVRGTSRLQHRPHPAAPAVAGPSTMPSQRTGADRRRLLRACPSPDFRHKLLLDGHPSEADLSRCDDDKGSSQATRMLGDEVYDIAADLTTGLRRVPEQDNAQARLSLCEHELTEVFPRSTRSDRHSRQDQQLRCPVLVRLYQPRRRHRVPSSAGRGLRHSRSSRLPGSAPANRDAQRISSRRWRASRRQNGRRLAGPQE